MQPERGNKRNEPISKMTRLQCFGQLFAWILCALVQIKRFTRAGELLLKCQNKELFTVLQISSWIVFPLSLLAPSFIIH